MSEPNVLPAELVPVPNRGDSASEPPVVVEELPVCRISVVALTGNLSARTGGLDPRHVELLADAENRLPPILVHRPTMRVLDGVHRLAAARWLERPSIWARFVDGNEADAFILAVRSNVGHGLALDIADRKRAAGRIVRSHPLWSDRRIASATGLAARTIGAVRRSAGDSAAHRVGQDGRVRPLNGIEGRQRAAEIILAEPGLSLRQVARVAGISPETVRDVRAKLRPDSTGTEARSQPAAARPNPSVTAPAASDGHHATTVVPPDAGRSDPRARFAALQALRHDPAVRSTETGRMLLRLLDLHALSTATWQRIGDDVPAHSADVIAEAARACAIMWTDLSCHLASSRGSA